MGASRRTSAARSPLTYEADRPPGAMRDRSQEVRRDSRPTITKGLFDADSTGSGLRHLDHIPT